MIAPESDVWEIGERSIAVTNLDKVFWPDAALTKGDMLRYYQGIAPTLLPHLRGRPVTLRVFPDGIGGPSYYRRRMPGDAPPWLGSVGYLPKTSEEAIRVPVVDDAAGLVWLANQGAIEFHPWASHLPDLTRPDQAILDLDPGDAATFGEVLQAATRVREALARLGLVGYPKTSGGRGLHVYLPLAAGQSFEGVRAWVEALAGQLAAAHPQLIAVAHGPTHQGGQMTIDHAQNSVGRNTAGPYTARAQPGAPISTPPTWDEVESGHLDPTRLTPQVVLARVQRAGDLFAGTLQGGQRLPEWEPGPD